MIKVFSSPDLMTAHTVKFFLEARGIPATTLGDHRVSACGLLPPIECWVDVAVLNEDQAEEATTALRDYELQSESEEQWTCPGCGEQLRGQFFTCWNCGTSRDGTVIPRAETCLEKGADGNMKRTLIALIRRGLDSLKKSLGWPSSTQSQ